jgi:hypothetical protein
MNKLAAYLQIFLLITGISKAYGSEYFAPEIIEYFLNPTDKSVKSATEKYYYFPNRSFGFFTDSLVKDFKHETIIDKFLNDRDIHIKDIKMDDYFSIAVFMIQNILKERTDTHGFKELKEDFKNICSMLMVGSMISNEEIRNKIFKSGIEYIEQLDYKKLKIDNIRYDAVSSALQDLFNFLSRNLYATVDKHHALSENDSRYWSHNIFTRDVMHKFYFNLITLDSPLSKLQIDLKEKINIMNSSPDLKSNYFYFSETSHSVYELHPFWGIPPDDFPEDMLYKIHINLIEQLKQNSLYQYLINLSKEEVEKLDESMKSMYWYINVARNVNKENILGMNLVKAIDSHKSMNNKSKRVNFYKNLRDFKMRPKEAIYNNSDFGIPKLDPDLNPHIPSDLFIEMSKYVYLMNALNTIAQHQNRDISSTQ